MRRNVLSKTARLNMYGNGLIEIQRFKKRMSKTFFIKNELNFLNFNSFFNYCRDIIIAKLKDVSEKNSLKFNICIECTYENFVTLEFHDAEFKTSNVLAHSESNFSGLLNIMFNKILKEESEFVAKGSGWSLKTIDGLQLRTNILNPLRGLSYIPLPKHIQNKKAIINVKNKDMKCFKYAILSKYDNRQNKSVFSSKYFKTLEKKSKLNFSCISFPTPLKEIKIFERINNVSVNVFGLDDEGFVYPVYLNSCEKIKNFDLFLFENGISSHYN